MLSGLGVGIGFISDTFVRRSKKFGSSVEASGLAFFTGLSERVLVWLSTLFTSLGAWFLM